MDAKTQAAKAEAFRAMHDRSRILVLPNAWDAMSARIFEAAGFGAVATTSAGLAYSIGYPDGEVAPRDEIVAAIARIAKSVRVPLSADIESGFSRDTASLKSMIKAVIEAGAIGINIEDAIHGGAPQLYSQEDAAARIKAARAAADEARVPIVINARTDVFLLGIGEKSTRLEHAVRRANAYRVAGADCLFVPGPADPEIIRKLASAIDGPINVLARPGMPNAAELQKLGVARVSVGSGPAHAAMSVTRRIADELLSSGSYSLFLAPGTISYMEANQLMSRAS
jgi:2-methylisocitrate lyase-like PEP mutase family enzyme